MDNYQPRNWCFVVNSLEAVTNTLTQDKLKSKHFFILQELVRQYIENKQITYFRSKGFFGDHNKRVPTPSYTVTLDGNKYTFELKHSLRLSSETTKDGVSEDKHYLRFYFNNEKGKKGKNGSARKCVELVYNKEGNLVNFLFQIIKTVKIDSSYIFPYPNPKKEAENIRSLGQFSDYRLFESTVVNREIIRRKHEIVMTLFPGETLEYFLDKNPTLEKLSLNQRLALVKAIFECYSTQLTEKNYVHGDLHWGNILVMHLGGTQFIINLIDFESIEMLPNETVRDDINNLMYFAFTFVMRGNDEMPLFSEENCPEVLQKAIAIINNLETNQISLPDAVMQLGELIKDEKQAIHLLSDVSFISEEELNHVINNLLHITAINDVPSDLRLTL